jgi:hypothetical protein
MDINVELHFFQTVIKTNQSVCRKYKFIEGVISIFLCAKLVFIVKQNSTKSYHY